MKLTHFITSIILFLCIVTGCATLNPDNPSSIASSDRSLETLLDQSSDTVSEHQTDNADMFESSSDSETTASGFETSGLDSDEEERSSLSASQIQTILDDALEFCQASQEFWQKGELDNAIQALDQAYSLITKITENNPKVNQQKEDLRFMIAKRILEIHASRHIVVNGEHNAIPITINKHVQKEIDRMTTGRDKNFFKQSFQRSGRYRPYIVAELKKAGMPTSLSWLPLVESGFKTRALSKARALGLWQFIPSTGYKFGLTRNTYIDERLDPVKATQAAIKYLRELHQIFGDWETVLAAYNCGEGRILRTIRNQNINYLDNFWDLYERLPWETARYVPKFLATLHIVNHPEKYGLDSLTVDTPLEYETVEVNRHVSLKSISHHIDVPENLLRELNPELRHSLLPDDTYLLKVPQNKKEVLLAKIDTVPISSPPKPQYIYHRVRRGQTLSIIAKRYGTSTSRIARANNIRRKNYIVSGKILKIPVRGTTIAKVPERAFGKSTQHRVKRGDSLWIIAKRYGTTTQKIISANNLRTTRLYVGQTLHIPGRGDSSSPSTSLYIVKRGDSLFDIAQKHNVPLRKLIQLNNLSNKNRIYPGQTLYIR